MLSVTEIACTEVRADPGGTGFTVSLQVVRVWGLGVSGSHLLLGPVVEEELSLQSYRMSVC